MAKRKPDYVLTDEFCRGAGPGVHRDGPRGIAGFLLRVGQREKSFALRLERKGQKATNVYLGPWPATSADAAREAATEKRKRFDAGLPVLDSAAAGALTVATAWADFKDAPRRGSGYDKKPLTVRSHLDAFNRLDETIHRATLRALSADPSLMKAEAARITNKNGPSASAASVRFVKALYRHAATFLDETLPAQNPCRQCIIRKSTEEQPALPPHEMPAWNAVRLGLPNEVRREYHLFALLSGLRRNDIETLEWKSIRPRDRVAAIGSPKGGVERKGFDLVLTLPMIACLNRAKRAGRRLYPQQAARWVFPGGSADGHMNHANDDGIATNHTLRRTYGSIAIAAGVPEPTVDMFLDHRSKTITGIHYVKASALGQYLASQQRAISKAICVALRDTNR